MRCENVHRPVSEWDFAFPLAHAQVSQCKRITLHKLCMDLRLDRYNTGTEFTGWSRSHIICHIHTLHTDPAHHVLNRRDGYTHTAEALSDVMPWVYRCILLSCSRFYCCPSVTILPLLKLQWSLCGLSPSLLTFSIR